MGTGQLETPLPPQSNLDLDKRGKQAPDVMAQILETVARVVQIDDQQN